jgi:zinc protease
VVRAIPPGPPLSKPGAWIAKMTGEKRGTMEDRVPQPALFLVWNVPPFGNPDAMRLDLASAALAEGKNARLYKRLVYDEQLATEVSAFNWEKELGSQFIVQIMARPGADLAKIEQITKEEIARFLREGPSAAELERAKMGLRADFVRSIERVGGFGGVSDVLASNQVYMGDPSYYKTRLEIYQAATAGQVKRAASDWLSDGVYVLEVHPYPTLQTSGTAPDRSTLSPAPTDVDTKFPTFTTQTLSNGLQLIVAPRPGVPVVNVLLLVGAGYAADPRGKAGLASLTADMLDEGTKTSDALTISDRLQRLGATLSTGATLDLNSVGMTALRENLAPSLELLADVALHPAFASGDFARKQKEQLVGIQQEKVEPNTMALRVMPRLLYGAEHAYGTPFTGAGTEQTVESLTPQDLAAFHQTWFKPNNASLIVVGATTADDIRPVVEQAFRNWARGEVPTKNVAPVPPRQRADVYLIDRPGSDQSVIVVGRLVPPRNSPDEIAVGVLNNVLGGQFVSRINMNLREDKHWSYGARTRVVDAVGQRPFIVVAPVQTDKTKESVQEVVKELRGIIGDRPVTPEELAEAQASITLALPGRWETNAAVAGSIGEIVSFGLKHDYFDQYAEAIRALQLADVQKAATSYVEPDRVVWVIVGDREKIEPGLRSLGMGDIQLIDAG